MPEYTGSIRTVLEERKRINHQIRIAQVMVIDDDGNQLGVMSPDEGCRIAADKGLDLVEVAPSARPPVCRIMDYGRFRYEQRKRTKKQQHVQTKIIKLRPKTDTHDLETKLRHARRFLEGGDRVRFVVRMRGRERAVTERWVKQLVELTAQLEDIGTPHGRPQLEGGGVTCTLEPKKAKDSKDSKEQKPASAPKAAPAAQTASEAEPAPAAAPEPSASSDS